MLNHVALNLSGSVADLLQIEKCPNFSQSGSSFFFYPQCNTAHVVDIVVMAKIFIPKWLLDRENVSKSQ